MTFIDNNFFIVLGIILIILFLITIYLMEKYIIFAQRYNIIDVPNQRSSHLIPIPRGGGIVIAIMVQFTTLLLYKLQLLPRNLMLAFSCSFILAIVGFIDDLLNLSIKIRLMVQLFLGAIAIYWLCNQILIFYNISYELSLSFILDHIKHINAFNLNNLFNLILSIFLLIWSINLFNFMDGIDGIAGMEAIWVLLLGGGILILITNNIGFASYLFAIVAIILGFLKFNWPPAKIFMGDAGSYFLGFVLGLSMLISHYVYQVSLLYWLILYAAFIVDASFTLIKRMLNGEPWYQPHREHIYQKMQDCGYAHKAILYWLMIINSILGVAALIAYYYQYLWQITVIIYLLLGIVYIYYYTSKFGKGQYIRTAEVDK